MTAVVPHSDNGYGWGMDDSSRLRAEVDKRAAKRAATPRAPIGQVVADLARRQGVNPALLDMTRPENRERADQLLAAKEVELRRERIERQAEILATRLPVIYRNARLPDEPWTDAVLAWLVEFRTARAAGNPLPGLVLMGPKGTGKTWTAAALTRILLTEDSIPVTFCTTQEFIDSVKPSHDGLDMDMIQFESTPVLALDDFGAERETDFGVDRLMKLAQARAANGLPNIITTNLFGEDIWKRYDERLVDRLFGGTRLVYVTGESRRRVPFSPATPRS